MLIDGDVVVQWPGWHRAFRDARRKRKVRLEAGIHRFAYYHVQGNADPIMVAAWLPKGGARAQPIPRQFFLPPLKTVFEDARHFGEDFAVGFEWDNAAETVLEDVAIVTMRFTDTSFPRSAPTARRHWDFGDGVTSMEFRPSHTYLNTGVYTVTMKAFRGGREHLCTQRVVVDRDWARQTTLHPEAPEKAAERVGAYPLKDLSGRALWGALRLFEAVERWEDYFKASEVLSGKLHQLAEPAAAEAAAAMARRWREEAHDPRKALAVLARAERVLTSPEHRARVAVLAGETQLFDMESPTQARVSFEHVVEDYASAGDHVRLALLRLGDVARELGQAADARHYYETSAKRRPDRKPGRAAMARALRALETEDLLRRRELDAAEEQLRLWEWQEPADKLRGHWSALWVRLAVLRKAWPQAMREAETLVRVNPTSQYVPEILLALAESRLALKMPKEAQAALARLIEEYPDSPLAPEAKARLATMRQ
jgi:tetratricopeptide (TPR) repeat protein